MARYVYLVQKKNLTRDEALSEILPVKGKNYRLVRESWYGKADQYLLYAPLIGDGTLILMKDGQQTAYEPTEEDLAANDYMVLKRTAK